MLTIAPFNERLAKPHNSTQPHNRGMDFRTTAAGHQYGVRASALIMHAGKLLTYSHHNKYFVPGGAVHVGEHSTDAVRREIREELGIDCTVRQLAFVGEHLFTVHGMPNHRIEFHYLVDVDSETVPITTRDEGHHYPCVWLPLQSLADYPLKPEFLTHELPQWDGGLKHLTTRE